VERYLVIEIVEVVEAKEDEKPLIIEKLTFKSNTQLL